MLASITVIYSSRVIGVMSSCHLFCRQDYAQSLNRIQLLLMSYESQTHKCTSALNKWLSISVATFCASMVCYYSNYFLKYILIYQYQHLILIIQGVGKIGFLLMGNSVAIRYTEKRVTLSRFFNLLEICHYPKQNKIFQNLITNIG